MKHIIPLETSVSFEDTATVFKVSSYQELLGPCEADCRFDHDCYEESYITVREEIIRAFPLSKLLHVFDQPHHAGRLATAEEKKGYL